MIRRPPRSTLDRSSAASDVYKRQQVSPQPATCWTCKSTDVPRKMNEMGAANFYKAKWKDPVSYTHLRAHETVLDLVCRLLLEKTNKQKKKKQTQT